MRQQKSAFRIDSVYLWLFIILALAAILRFYHYAAFSFSNDELSAINRLRFNNFHDLVEKGFYVDGHPGGIQVMLWYWVKLFGVSEASLRFPFVIFGILSVLFSFLTARQMFGPVAGLFVSAAMASLEFPLLYSQIARPYGSGVFFCLLMVWFWFRVVNDHAGSTKTMRLFDLAGYAFSTALCMYNHYFSFLLAAIVGITGLFIIKRNKVIGYIISGLSASLLFLPHLYITLNHLTYKGVGLWLGKPKPLWIIDHILFVFNNQWWLLALTVIIAGILAWLNRKSIACNKYRFIALLFFILPLLVGYVYSVKVNPVLQHPVLIFSFPFLLFAIFSFTGDKLKPMHSGLLAVFLLAGIYSTVVYGSYYRKQHFGEFKDVAFRISEASGLYGKGNVTNVVSANNPYYISYYFEKQKDSAKIAMTNITADSLASLGRLVRECGTLYFLYAWTKPSPPEADDIIMATYPYLAENIYYGDLSALKLFTINKPSSNYVVAQVFASRNLSFDEEPPKVSVERLNRVMSAGGKCSFNFDSTIEYGPNISIPISEIRGSGLERVVSEAWVYFDNLPAEAIFVTSLEIPGKEPLIWKGALIKDYAGSGKWQKVLQTFILPEKTNNEAVLKMYIWNKGKESFLVDEMKLSIEVSEYQLVD